MEKEDLIISGDTRNYLTMNELFDRIKRNCKVKTRKSLLVGLINLLLIVAFFLTFFAHGISQQSIVLVILLAIDGFICLGEYLSNKIMGNFDAPDKFLNWYDNENTKILRNLFAFCGLGMICYFFYYLIRNIDINSFGLFPFILILVALAVMFIYVLLKYTIIEDNDIKHLREHLDKR